VASAQTGILKALRARNIRAMATPPLPDFAIAVRMSVFDLEGAAEEWERANGQPPTDEELHRILARYPGDPLCPDGAGVDRTATGG
jgi:hypothetical protein